jgi:hypothetical protein
VSFTRSRLRRLEAANAGGAPSGKRGAPCPECKLPPDGPGYVVYEEGAERPKAADERCLRCGRCRWFVIKVVYEEDKGGGVIPVG